MGDFLDSFDKINGCAMRLIIFFIFVGLFVGSDIDGLSGFGAIAVILLAAFLIGGGAFKK